MNLHVREMLWRMALKLRECEIDQIKTIIDQSLEKIERAVRVKDELLSEKRVAAIYPFLDERKLRNYRQRGGGPKFIKFGTHKNSRVYYKIADIEAWIVENQK